MPVGIKKYILGELFEKAREKVKEDGYEYKKGYSISGSSSHSSEISDQTSVKEKGKSTKQKHTDAEEQQKAISNIKALIESTQNHIRIKQLRMQKLKACNDFRQCDVITSKMTKLRDSLSKSGPLVPCQKLDFPQTFLMKQANFESK